jgi:hypothetical protein
MILTQRLALSQTFIEDVAIILKIRALLMEIRAVLCRLRAAQLRRRLRRLGQETPHS